MDNIHHFSRPVVARDVTDNAAMDLNTAYASLAGTSKHVSMSITELCYLLARGEAAFRTCPLLTVMVCHVVPRDLFSAEVPAIDPAPVRIAKAGPPSAPDVAAMGEMIEGTDRPVIFAGGGFRWSDGSAALMALADTLEIPVVASTGHADIMPRGNTVAGRLTREADVIVVLGARLGFNSTFHRAEYVNPQARIAHVDIDGGAVGRYFAVELAVKADARETALVLAAAGRLTSTLGVPA